MTPKDNDTDDDDFALFRQEVRDAEPLALSQRVQTPVKTKTVKKSPQALHQSSPVESRFSDMYSPDLVGNEEYLEYQGPGIQHRTFAKLRTGKIHIEAELDLHGMTLNVAEPTLAEFIEFCQQQHIRYVRLVHGKGWSSKDNKPVLKSHINHWLRQNQNVLAFCSATVPDGGAGALYVLLKKLSHL